MTNPIQALLDALEALVKADGPLARANAVRDAERLLSDYGREVRQQR